MNTKENSYMISINIRKDIHIQLPNSKHGIEQSSYFEDSRSLFRILLALLDINNISNFELTVRFIYIYILLKYNISFVYVEILYA